MSVRAIEAEVSIKSGVQAECTIGREVIVEVHDDVTLDSLTVTANGQYEPAEGVDGFSNVSVEVPAREPVIESLSVVENGVYEPSEGIDGYGSVTVNVPPDIKASGSFVKTGGSGVTYTLDTGNTEWTHLLIRPHEFPHSDLTSSQQSRAIMSKYIDVGLDAMFTAYMSSAGNAYNSGSYQIISEKSECIIENGVVHMTGTSSTVGKWIDGKQYDWWAW